MTGNLGKENWKDVVVIDLLRHDPVWLGVSYLSPHHVAIAPDANSVAIAAGDGAIYSMAAPFNNSPTGGGRRARLFVSSGEEDLSHLVFAPDGRSIAAMGQRLFSVWDWPTARLLHQHQYKRTGIAARSVVYSADSRTIASLDDNGDLWLCDARSGASIQVVAINETPHHDIVVDFETQRIAIVREPLISVFSFGAEDAIWSAACDSPIIALSPSGRSLAFVQFGLGSNQVVVSEVETGKPRCRFEVGQAMMLGMKFASDTLLYSADSRGNVRAWNTDFHREQWAVPLLDSAPVDDGSVHPELFGNPSP